jgi:hypothetical protein
METFSLSRGRSERVETKGPPNAVVASAKRKSPAKTLPIFSVAWPIDNRQLFELLLQESRQRRHTRCSRQNEDPMERYPRCADEPGVSGHCALENVRFEILLRHTLRAPPTISASTTNYDIVSVACLLRLGPASRSAESGLSTRAKSSTPPKPLPSASPPQSRPFPASQIYTRSTVTC